MALDQNYKELDDKSLIEIIEKLEDHESLEGVRAKDELDGRNLSLDRIKELAIAVNEVIAYEMIMNEGTTKENVTMHKSSFLDEEEIRQIYIQQLGKYIKDKDQFRFDVWSYAIGG